MENYGIKSLLLIERFFGSSSGEFTTNMNNIQPTSIFLCLEAGNQIVN
jgi:hypothetical protein